VRAKGGSTLRLEAGQTRSATVTAHLQGPGR
jgi:hypothetical protein